MAPVRSASTLQLVPIWSIVAGHAASPMVKDGKMMWKLTTKANWIRES